MRENVAILTFGSPSMQYLPIAHQQRHSFLLLTRIGCEKISKIYFLVQVALDMKSKVNFKSQFRSTTFKKRKYSVIEIIPVETFWWMIEAKFYDVSFSWKYFSNVKERSEEQENWRERKIFLSFIFLLKSPSHATSANAAPFTLASFLLFSSLMEKHLI